VNALSVSNKPATVLTATGGVSVDPNLKQSDNSALFDFPVVATGNKLTIQPVAHLSDAAASLGTSQKAVAGYLQQLFDSGASMDDGFTQLAHLSGGKDYAQSLQSMTGSGLGAFGAFRVNTSRAFANDLYQGCRDSTFDRNSSSSCSWARFSGASSDQDARGDTEGYHADSYMLEVGGQAGLSDHLALVGSLGSEKTQFHGEDNFSSQIKGDSAVGGVGLNFANGPLELSGAIDGAYGWYRSYRTITVGEDAEAANATPRQWQIGAHLRASYAVTVAGQAYVKPFVDGHAIRVSNSAFTESGTSPFRLSVDGNSDTAVLGGPGVEFGTYIPIHSGVELHPFISAAAEFGQDVLWTTTARFASQASGPGFDVKTAGPGTVGRFAIGADLMNVKNLSFSLLYSPEVGSGYSSQGGSARISYTF
jgi:outer membrane autotransporter protein